MGPAFGSPLWAEELLTTLSASAEIGGIKEPVTGVLNVQIVCHWFDPIPRIIEAFLPGREAEW